ncbi:hypothetical protein [Paraburkholderia terrae]|uniref:hypothetical protein n=1 Tax=Paraburkholderia terrae TaxID=311230 RepID=UPI001EE19017|nr:hypothetical protein [Paraburkholderia terrae]GJH02546.1 hypothetical protein CBA19C8_18335 [Paraburkholderia terrae]
MATKKPAIASLRPYLAPLLLKRVQPGTSDALMKDLRKEIEAAITNGSNSSRSIIGQSRYDSPGNLLAGVIEYVEESPPSWAPNSSYCDVNHHVVIVAIKGSHVAICVSDTPFRGRLAKSLKAARPVSREILERSFVGVRARAMWLNGIHPQTDWKPTAKTLMGQALEHTLDPLGDQSFYYSAVRSHVSLSPSTGSSLETLVGASPDAGHIWVNRPGDWNEFAAKVEQILDIVASPPSSPTTRRFQALAQAVSDLVNVKDAYDIALVPPELLSDEDVDGQTRELAMQWAYDAQFDIVSTSGANLISDVHLAGIHIGRFELALKANAPHIDVSVKWTVMPKDQNLRRKECEKFLMEPEWLKVYYESAHTLAYGRLFISAYQDQQFEWTFQSMIGYDVTAEKPEVLPTKTLAESIGEPKHGGGGNDNSLFGFILMQLFPNGWLACDDGSMELADFVHIDDRTDEVTLIHAKAAKSADPQRQISVSRYEVVVGQAVKNLRHLMSTTLVAQLEKGKLNQMAKAVWYNGVRQADRTGIIARAGQLAPNHPKRVIILQPQLTKTEHDNCRSLQPPNVRALKMRQLDTLMLSAELSARAVGATLLGIGAR